MKGPVELYAWSAMVTPFMFWFILGALLIYIGKNGVISLIGWMSYSMGLLSLWGFNEYYKHKNPVLLLVREKDLSRILKALEERDTQ